MIECIENVVAAAKVTKKDSSTSDSSDDSDEDNKKPAAAAKKPIVQVSNINGKTVTNGKSSSSDDDSSDDSDEKTAPVSKKSPIKSTVAKVAKASSTSESSDSDSDGVNKTAKVATKLLPPIKTSTPNNFKPVKFVSSGFNKSTIEEPKKAPPPSSSSSDDDSSDEKDANKTIKTPVSNKNISTNLGTGKKRKLSEGSDAPSAKKPANNTSFNKSFNNNSNSKQNTPFRRVKTEDVHVDSRLSNNSFDAKVNEETKTTTTHNWPVDKYQYIFFLFTERCKRIVW